MEEMAAKISAIPPSDLPPARALLAANSPKVSKSATKVELGVGRGLGAEKHTVAKSICENVKGLSLCPHEAVFLHRKLCDASSQNSSREFVRHDRRLGVGVVSATSTSGNAKAVYRRD